MIPQQKKSLLDEGSNCILLHRGGEASVYLFCLNNGEWLVLKWFRQHFDTELVGNACKIKDCGICKIREFGIRDETPYQLYEFVEGISSDSISAMPVTVAICALRQLVASLRKARTAGVSHGDLNPSNVIFSLKETKDAPDFQTVLVDWGIVGPGALSFAAPERFQGRCADEKSDMFSLGLLLFRWLTGENLVQGRDFDSFASRIAALTTDSVTEKLFYSGKFSPEEISALEPIWNSTLRIASEDRAEDFDELDELLEIALDKVGGGEVRQSCVRRKFLEPYLIQVQKMGRKFSSELENPECTQFPFKNNSSKNCKNFLKIAILVMAGILLSAVAVFMALGTKTPDVDETGQLMLKNSRDLDLELMDESSPPEESSSSLLPVEEILKELPTPTKE